MQTIQKGTNKNFTHMNVPQLSATKRLKSRDDWFRFLIPIGRERWATLQAELDYATDKVREWLRRR